MCGEGNLPRMYLGLWFNDEHQQEPARTEGKHNATQRVTFYSYFSWYFYNAIDY